MITSHGFTARRAAFGAAATVLALTLVACGKSDGSDDAPRESSAASATRPAPNEQTPSEGSRESPEPAPSQPLATITGANGFEVLIYSAQRDSGGFLTVTGSLKNTTAKPLIAPINWSGEEVSVKRTGPSLAGVTLTDKTEKKRYYVLRDTEGFPLTTTGITSVKAGESISIFAQFPAPPAGTAEVDFQLSLIHI
ncbi:hypothetical protein C6N75_12580, partial [Streptomyces solincola]